MEEQYMDINMVSMQIIMDAGDARVYISEALEFMENNDFESATERIAQAQDKIKSAHNAQTNIVQDEVRGITHAPSLLFTHAQDTLMTISSELYLAKQLLKIFKKIDKRFEIIEKSGESQ